MQRMLNLANDSCGATSIEYAAVAALISIVAVGTIGAIGSTVAGFFASIPAF